MNKPKSETKSHLRFSNSTKEKNNRSPAVSFIKGVGLTVLIIILLVGIIQTTMEQSSRGYSNNYLSTSSPPAPSNQITKKEIPGLLPGDVYIHYTKRGFSKSGPRKIADDVLSPNAGKYFWSLSKLDDHSYCSYDLTIYGPDGWSMDTIFASIVCPTPGDLIPAATNYLPFVVSIDYTGSNITEAISWVKGN